MKDFLWCLNHIFQFPLINRRNRTVEIETKFKHKFESWLSSSDSQPLLPCSCCHMTLNRASRREHQLTWGHGTARCLGHISGTRGSLLCPTSSWVTGNWVCSSHLLYSFSFRESQQVGSDSFSSLFLAVVSPAILISNPLMNLAETSG